MAKTARLKVFRLPIGFHDAYVAAPSRKAALEAWGADADLFARGLAERVEDPELMREPLAHPGQVIRRSRGTSAEQIAALPPDLPGHDADAPAEKPDRTTQTSPKRAAPLPEPRPDRSAVQAAERELDELKKRHRDQRDELAQRQAELERERRALDASQRDEAAEAETKFDKARAAYDQAMRKWRG